VRQRVDCRAEANHQQAQQGSDPRQILQHQDQRQLLLFQVLRL
jgi:hypothetical protein